VLALVAVVWLLVTGRIPESQPTGDDGDQLVDVAL